MKLEIEYIPINELTPYSRNARKHSEADVNIIAQSIEKYGFNDAVGVWGDKNIIVEGHGRVLAAQKLGLEIIPCVRLDHLSEKERREYAIAHNRSAEMSEWDFDLLQVELDGLDLDDFDFGFELGLEETEEDKPDDTTYTDETSAPQYEPSGESVSLSDCVDAGKVNELLKGIEASSVTEEEKQFLRIAAYRHYAFTYKRIADYYATASAEMQDLMERSALVIIDYEDAIKNGYAELRGKVKELLSGESY